MATRFIETRSQLLDRPGHKNQLWVQGHLWDERDAGGRLALIMRKA